MPFGLIDYNLRFFAAASLQKIGMEDHYAQWLETMFAHFGQKWLCLFRGPFWQYDVQDSSSSGASLHPVCDQNACRNDVPSDSNIINNALRECSLDLTEFSEDPLCVNESGDTSVMQVFELSVGNQEVNQWEGDNNNGAEQCLDKERLPNTSDVSPLLISTSGTNTTKTESKFSVDAYDR
jgi:hypothetical protein